MCGIVGLYAKSPQIESKLGDLLATMLIEMSDRGPDSAGVAIYRNPCPEGETKMLVHSGDPEYAWHHLHEQLSKAFGKNNGGAIPSNLLQIPNSESNGQYTAACKAVGVTPHPARFPAKLPEFFIRFLTDPGDTVLDIFAGSNTTGMVAESEARHWLAFEERADYLAASAFRFVPKDLSTAELQVIYNRIESGDGEDLSRFSKQMKLFV